MKRTLIALATMLAVALLPAVAVAAGAPGGNAHAGGAPHLDGSQLSLIWPLPFAGMLLSIAILPVVAPHSWEHHFG